MRRISSWVIPAFWIMAAAAHASYIPVPGPVAGSLGKAENIVVVTIQRFVPDMLPKRSLADAHDLTNDEYVESFTFQGAGVYHVKTLQLIKGSDEAEFDIHLPRVSAFDYGKTEFPMQPGARILLLLKKDELNKWVPVEPLRPVIPISDAGKGTLPQGADAIDVMLASMEDDALRPTLMRILQDVKDDRVAAAMVKHTDDMDFILRSEALYCLAVNQDVSAIPKIAKLAVEMEKSNRGTGATVALTLYKTPKAKQLLEPLAAEGTDYVRQNALLALTTLADRDSIPYLIKAMGNDDHQHFVAEQAYGIIRKLLGANRTKEREYYLAHSRDDIEMIKSWWAKEKPQADTATAPASK